MALTEKVIQDKIEIVGEFKYVQVRTATVIMRDDQELSRSFSRHIVTPTDDITNESDEVKAICNAIHTQELKDAYKAHLSNLDNHKPGE